MQRLLSEILLDQKERQIIEWDSISAAIEQLRSSLQKLGQSTDRQIGLQFRRCQKKLFLVLPNLLKSGETLAPYDLYSDWVSHY